LSRIPKFNEFTNSYNFDKKNSFNKLMKGKYIIFIGFALFIVNTVSSQIERIISSRQIRLSITDSMNYDTAIRIFQTEYQYFADNHLLPHEDATSCLNNIGRHYLLKGNYGESIRYFKKSINSYSKLNSLKSQENCILTYNNIGIAYVDSNEIDSAKHYYKLALQKCMAFASASVETINYIYGSAIDFFNEYGTDEELQEIKELRFLNRPAPDFNLLTKQGKVLSLSHYRGKWLLLDFWASWCGPCLREMPNLRHIDSSFTNLSVLGISVDEDIESWINRIAELDLSWTQALDNTQTYGSTAQKYGSQRIPLTVLIDPEGTIRAYGLRGDSLTETIEKLTK
jgi:peroxiredoxin